MRRVISVVVINEDGVLSRISGLFSGRGYNIDSLTVAPIPESPYSRVSIVTNGDERVFEQIVKQLHKLIPTYKVIESGEFIEKEMLLVKIPLGENLANFEAMLRSYNGIIANVTENYVVAMIADDAKRIDCFLKIVKKFNPIDLVRSGSVLMDIQ
ncbi:Acetolactate synthase isozyme 3 small subunit [Campylobacter majalis]|uniref:Acetolactate synthase small subunit n=1 Tax=Campylobacter majalis TaxID=2790656 RepID=A0ABM8Q4N5_9BACT|nr:acetolactate synthase small subunit [Campylobacter majalis]CAD7287743.1 Acetolactate synthase isozyme 3 small subunit [Campylobacter majalis]